MGPGRPRRAPRRAALLLGALSAALLPGCASLPRPVFRGEGYPGREVRPEAGPEYDVLVAQEHRREGRPEEELAAWQRALAKDEGSAYLHRMVAEGLVRALRPDEALAHAERAFELEPDEPANRYLLANLHRLRSDVPAAEQVLLGPDGRPFDRTAALLLHQIYLEGDRADDSLRVALALEQQDPFSVEPKLALAASYQRLGRLPEAIALLRKCIELDPGNLRLRALLARSLRDSGDRDGEIAVYRQMLEIEPGHHATLTSLADALVEKEDVAGALAVFEELVRDYPDDARAQLRLGLLQFEQRRWAEAVRHLESYSELSGEASPEIRFFLGTARRRAGDEGGAVADFERIPADHRSYPDARMELAAIFERRGDYARALAEVERAQAARPSQGSLLYAATLRAKAGDVDGAVAVVTQMLEQDPDNDELLYNLGLIHAEANRIDESMRFMQRALEHNPDNANALNYVGYTWAERGERLDEAERMITRALVLRPDDGYITDSLGWVYYMRARALSRAGKPEEARRFSKRARETLLRAEELTGGDPVVSEHLGDIELLDGDRAAALRRYEEAVELEPRPSEQPHLVEKLEQLRQELR